MADDRHQRWCVITGISMADDRHQRWGVITGISMADDVKSESEMLNLLMEISQKSSSLEV
ncbi:hypothetical protein DPMN_075285 [Dreissena polymorpha]|uniref:Uncharacterized protein n=1 Tax=Dreissena polymorpha TaxID=45954 RepID=A0A9D3YK22_DREPO|nr:hypothetical protein DPMN_075285 [Dreissena polymorpha]